MADKILGYGTELQLGDGETPEEFTAIPGLKDFELPTGQADKVDVTAHDSPDRSKEYIAGLLDTNSFDFEIYWDPNDDTHQDLWALKGSGDVRNWKVVEPDDEATEFSFTAFVADMVIAHPVEDAMTAKVTIEIAGAVTMAGYDS